MPFITACGGGSGGEPNTVTLQLPSSSLTAGDESIYINVNGQLAEIDRDDRVLLLDGAKPEQWSWGYSNLNSVDDAVGSVRINYVDSEGEHSYYVVKTLKELRHQAYLILDTLVFGIAQDIF